MVWMREKPDCKACQQIYKKKEEEPPCSTCRPPLLVSNEDVINVYLLVQDQVNVSFSGQIIGLRIEAVCDVMEILKIKDRKDCLRRVIDLFRHFQKEDEMKRGK